MQGSSMDHLMPTASFHVMDYHVLGVFMRVWDTGCGEDPSSATSYLTSFLPCDAVMFVISAEEPARFTAALWEMYALSLHCATLGRDKIPWLVILNTFGKLSDRALSLTEFVRYKNRLPPGVPSVWHRKRIPIPLTCTQRWNVNTLAACVRITYRAVFSKEVCKLIASYYADWNPSLFSQCDTLGIPRPTFPPNPDDAALGHGFLQNVVCPVEGMVPLSFEKIHKGPYNVMVLNCICSSDAARALQWIAG
eukprot:PhF_6_TR9939/c0_g1_i1/m.15122